MDKRPQLLSTEGIAMMVVAAGFDIVPLVLLPLNIFAGLGEIIATPVRITGIIVLGTWMWMSSEKLPFWKKAINFLSRRGPLMATDAVPLIGAGPWQIINVFMFLKK